MVRVLGMKYSKGEFTSESTGEVIAYDNVNLYIATDEVDNVIGLYVKEEKVPRERVKLIGCKKFEDIVGKDIEFGYSLIGAKPKINRILLLESQIESA